MNSEIRYQREPCILNDRYEVVSQLGQGGMGTVYVARDLRLAGCGCVVKKLRDDYFREDDRAKAVSFFEREMRLLSKLTERPHPNIVQIKDYFREGDDFYLVMEYVEGEDLHNMLAQRGEPFEEERVLEWSATIAEVLDFMHNFDPPIIYRDLKPSNIMIDSKGRVKLVDFGIARHYVEDSDNTHVVSAGYSPPEQYWGQATKLSDIYALGATMYFLLTGHEPLALQSSSPIKVNANISERTDQIVRIATAQEETERYQSALDMKADLEWRKTIGQRKPPLSAWALAICAGCLIIIAGLVVGLFWVNTTQKQESVSKLVQLKSKLEQELDKKNRELQHLKSQKADPQELENTRREIKDVQSKISAQRYATTRAMAIEAYRPGAENNLARPHPIGLPTSRQANQSAQANGPAATLAFTEQDESQLTDPDGLGTVEEGNDNPLN